MLIQYNWIWILDQQLVLFERKVKQIKFNKHNNMLIRPFKQITVNLFVKCLHNFINYYCFSDVKSHQWNCCNERNRIKNKRQKWFDREVNELTQVHEKFFFKVTSTRSFFFAILQALMYNDWIFFLKGKCGFFLKIFMFFSYRWIYEFVHNVYHPICSITMHYNIHFRWSP